MIKKHAYFFGTRWNRIFLSSSSSSSITKATGYTWSKSKLNFTPAGGSRRKFLWSCQQKVIIYFALDLESHQIQDKVSYMKLTIERAKICCCTLSSSLYPTHGGTAAPVNMEDSFLGNNIKIISGILYNILYFVTYYTLWLFFQGQTFLVLSGSHPILSKMRCTCIFRVIEYNVYREIAIVTCKKLQEYDNVAKNAGAYLLYQWLY